MGGSLRRREAAVAGVVRGRRDGDPGMGVEAVLYRDLQREGVAGLRREIESQQRSVLFLVFDLPPREAAEAVDRVVLVRLGQRDLIVGPVELVAAVGEAVGRRDERLPAGVERGLVRPGAVQDIAASYDRVRSEAPTRWPRRASRPR